MSQLTSIRLRPTDPDFLGTQAFDSGSVFYDSVKNTLVLMDGRSRGGFELLRADLTNATTGLGVQVSQTPPVNARSGSLWLDTESGELLIYLDDGDSSQWIQPSAPSFSVGSGGGSTYTLPTATTSTLGGVKVDGSTITINNGIITAVGGGGGGSGTVNSGVSGAIAYYPSAGTVVDDNSSLIWNSNILTVTGTIQATGQKNRIRFHWDTLADLNAEVSPVDYHGMIAHVHDTGKVYYAHAGAWVPVASEASLPNSFSTISVAGQTNVVADSTADTLTLVAGTNVTITTNATTDTITISASGSGGTASNSFSTIAVAGQSDVLAESATDTLTLVAGTNVTITTNATTDTVTVSAASSLDGLTDVAITTPSTGQVLKYNGTNWINDADATAGGAGAGTVTSVSVASANGFTGTVATASSTPAITIATSITGVLKGNATAISAAVAGTDYQAPIGTISGIVKGNGANSLTAATAGTDYQAPITLTTTGSSGAATFSGGTLNIPQYASGASTFSGLSDATSAALTVDEIYLQATTRLIVTANGSSAYLFDQYTGNNPTIYVTAGTTIAFDLGTGALSSHPFLIRFSGANYDTGLTHVTSVGVVTTGSSAQGKTSGTLYWKIPASISGTYGYLCQAHGSMIGTIIINPAGSLAAGSVTGAALSTGMVVQTQYVASGTRVSTTHSGGWQEPSSAYRVTITPVFANSMIIVKYHIPFNQNSASNILTVLRAFRSVGGTKSYALTSAGSSNGSRNVIAGGAIRPGNGYDQNDQNIESIQAVDFPGTTSTVTYGFESAPEGANTTTWGYTASDNSLWGYDADIVIMVQEIKQ